MAYTKIANIIQPEVFTANVIDMSAELSQFWQSGIISTVSDLGENFSQGVATVNMPFWDDLAGEDQLLDEDTNLTVQNLSMGQDVAVWHGRALVYGGTDLAQALNNNRERKSTRLNSSHVKSSYAVFCLKKKKKDAEQQH